MLDQLRNTECEDELVRLLRQGPINAMVLSEQERAAARRLQQRGTVRRFYASPAAQLLDIPSYGLADAAAGRPA